MADAQRTIELVFNGVDKTGAAVESALKNTENFAGSIQSATQPIADATFALLKMEAALLTAGAAVTAFSVKMAGDFDSSFREVATLIDVPLEGLSDFRQEILDYSVTSTSSLDDITGALYTAISAGQDYSDSIEFITAAEKLATAGRASLNDTTLVLASALNAYGAGAEEAGDYSAYLFQTVKSGLTTLPQLSTSLSQVTNIAATAGVSFDELLAAIAAITSTGTPTELAITQLKGALLGIIDPSKQVVDASKEMGIEFGAQRLAAVGLTGVMADVQRVTGNNAEEVAKLFDNSRALTGVLTLNGKAADAFAATLEQMANSSETLDKAWKIMTGSFESSIQIIQNALGAFFIAIGSPLLDEFNGVANSINAIFTELAKSAGSQSGIGEVVQFIESQFQGLDKALQEVARNIPQALDQADFSGFVNGVNVVTSALGQLFGGIDLTTANGLAQAISLAGKAFEGLSEFSAGVIESFEPLAGLFFDASKGIAEINSEAFNSAGYLAGLTTQLNLLSGVLVPVAAGLLSINQALQIAGSIKAVTLALGSVGGVGLLGALSALGSSAVGGAAGFAVGSLANKLTELATGTSLSTRLVDWVTSFESIGDKAYDIIDNINDLPPSFDAASNSLFNFVNDAGKLEEVSTDLRGLKGVLDQQFGIINELEPLPGILKKTSDAVNNIGDASEKLDLKERLAIIEAQSAITTANIEADAKKTVAAFESVSSSIKSTSDLLGTLYGELNDADNFRDRFAIEDQIAKENERLQAESEAQLKLLKSQLRINEAREAALKSGQAMIQVDGAGLQPHLEAIMFELLEAIQVRVNSDGYAMLLGIPG